jgi:hypothetical protein
MPSFGMWNCTINTLTVKASFHIFWDKISKEYTSIFEIAFIDMFALFRRE